MPASLLHLDSSASGERSVSRRLTAVFADAWTAGGGTVVHRDLHADPPPHLTHRALHWPRGDDPAEPQLSGARRLQDELVDELLAADVVVIGVPLYNFSIPSTLKAWVDHVHVPGRTAGPGTTPLAGRDVVLVGSRGAGYAAGTPTAGWDHALPPLEIVLGPAGLGMRVQTVTVDFTLAGELAELADHRDEHAVQLTAAEGRLAALADELVRPGG